MKKVQADELGKVEDPRAYAEELQRIVALYIVEEAPSQVNVGGETRQATEEAARSVINSAQQVYAVITRRCTPQPDIVFRGSGEGMVCGRHY